MPLTAPLRSLPDRSIADFELTISALPRYFRPFEARLQVGVRSRDTVRNARHYLAGLLLPGRRKSMEPIARRIPGADADRLQNFITDSPWNADEVQTQLTEVVTERFGDPHAALALDDTAFPKEGSASVGVARQWCGTLGKTANCQVGVTLYYVLPFERRPSDVIGFTLGLRLYLPKRWADDSARRMRARVPPTVRFEEKWQIGLDLIDRAREIGVPHRAVLADADYGRSGELRRALRERREPYLVGVQPHSLAVLRLRKDGTPIDATPFRVNELIPEVPAADWRSIRWAEGTKGPLMIRAVRYRVQVIHDGKPTDERAWLLLEWRPNEVKAYLAWGLEALSLTELIRVMRSRWPIELGYRQMKQELGLDHFEGRTWTGWHHHVTLVALAHSFLMTMRAERSPRSEESPLPSVERVVEELDRRVMSSLTGQAQRTQDPALRLHLLDRILALSDVSLGRSSPRRRAIDPNPREGG